MELWWYQYLIQMKLNIKNLKKMQKWQNNFFCIKVKENEKKLNETEQKQN